MVALAMVVLLGFAALVIDIGYLFRVRNELQNASDSAALAGARKLDGTATGITNARVEVQLFAQQHSANSSQVTIAAADILFGHWHFTNPVGCSPAPCFQSLGTEPVAIGLEPSVNAVQVVSRRTSATGNQLNFFFASFVGQTQGNVTASAVAVGGGPYTECQFPLVVPDCEIGAPATDGSCQWCMQFQSANTDTAGWTTFSENGQCGNNAVDALIIAACGQAGGFKVVNDECTGCGQKPNASQSIKTCNGNSMNKNNYCETIQEVLMWTGTPRAFKVRVPVLDSHGLTAANCGGFDFGQTHQIVGFSTMLVYGAQCGNNKPAVIDSTAGGTCAPPPSGKYITAKLLCDSQSSSASGGGFFGTDTPKIRLVQ